jgi:hypothetical protein
MKSLDTANSPAQLQDMTNGFRSLLAGQLKGLQRQYEDGTSFKSGPFAFENKLDPETRSVLSGAPDATRTPPPAASVPPGTRSAQEMYGGTNPAPAAAPAARPPLGSFLSQ